MITTLAVWLIGTIICHYWHRNYVDWYEILPRYNKFVFSSLLCLLLGLYLSLMLYWLVTERY